MNGGIEEISGNERTCGGVRELRKGYGRVMTADEP